MRMVVLKVIIGAGLLLVFPAFGPNDAAPFGLSWGPIEKIPRPSLQAREANLTLLIYHKDRLDKFQNTDEIVLEVCKNEGLQQVIWVSRLLSGGEMHERIEAIVEEGARRYGIADQSQRDVISWNDGRMKMTRISDKGLYRVLMASIGPGFESCANEHDSMMDTPMRDHWNRHFLDSSSQ